MAAMIYDDAAADRLEALYRGHDIAAQRADTLIGDSGERQQFIRTYARKGFFEPSNRLTTSAQT